MTRKALPNVWMLHLMEINLRRCWPHSWGHCDRMKFGWTFDWNMFDLNSLFLAQMMMIHVCPGGNFHSIPTCWFSVGEHDCVECGAGGCGCADSALTQVWHKGCTCPTLVRTSVHAHTHWGEGGGWVSSSAVVLVNLWDWSCCRCLEDKQNFMILHWLLQIWWRFNMRVSLGQRGVASSGPGKSKPWIRSRSRAKHGQNRWIS